MLDDNPNDNTTDGPDAAEASAPAAPVVKKTTRAPRKTAATRTAAAAPVVETAAPAETGAADVVPTEAAPTVKKTTRTRASAAKKTAASQAASVQDALIPDTAEGTEDSTPPVKKTAARKSAAKKTTTKSAAAKTTAAKAPAKKAAAKKSAAKKSADTSPDSSPETGAETVPEAGTETTEAAAAPIAVPLFQAPVVSRRTRSTAKKTVAPVPETVEDENQVEDEADTAIDTATEAATEADTRPAKKTAAKRAPAKKAAAKKGRAGAEQDPETDDAVESEDTDDDNEDNDDNGADNGDGTGPARRRRRRGGRRRRKGGEGSSDGQDGDSDNEDDDQPDASTGADSNDADQGEQGDGTSRRRRRRRRAGEEGEENDSEPNTVTRVRSRRAPEDEITALAGSTRLEAKKQRRREGREAGRRRAPIVSEAEFLARRESVDRIMVIRQREELTQIAVLEDKVLVEHYVARESQTSLIGNVYLGRVQNVLPSMEAAFIDIGKGRNAVLYAGEVNWAALGHKDGQQRKIESVLSCGQSILVQVTKDPIGHKGARLTSQISLAGRFLVYVPDGTTSGISRKLPDTERNRLKTLLKEIVPDTAGVIVRTAAEGASEDELTHDVERLKARWDDIEAKAKGQSPAAAVRRARPDPQGRARPVHRGLHQARHRG